jgi:hypothetical protein
VKHKIIQSIVIFCFLTRLIPCISLLENSFYIKYFYFYDTYIDLGFLIIIYVHAFFNWHYYTILTKYILRAIPILVLLCILKPYIDRIFYDVSYFFIVIATIYEAVKTNINKSK